jgi:hypothetical protein
VFFGHTAVDSGGSTASPAMMALQQGFTEPPDQTLLLVWAAGDGTLFAATGMEQNGLIAGDGQWANMTTNQRPSLTQISGPVAANFPGGLGAVVLGYNSGEVVNAGPQPSIFLKSSDLESQLFLEYFPTDSPPTAVPPETGGPAVLFQGSPDPIALPSNLFVAYTAQSNQQIYFCSINAENLETLSQPVNQLDNTYMQSIDTPALGFTPGGQLQLAFAGPGPENNLTIAAIDPANGQAVSYTVYPDQCHGGPALVNTVDGYAAAYVNKSNNIVLLYGVETPNFLDVTRTVFVETSWYAPAVATTNGVTYLAWIGTDQSSPQETGALNFADLGSMQKATCALADMLNNEAGPGAEEFAARAHRVRDTVLNAEASGRLVIALFDQHNAELGRLLDSHPGLRNDAWELFALAAPATISSVGDETPFSEEMLQAGERLMRRIGELATPPLQESISWLTRVLLPSLRGQTLADGLRTASQSAQ